MEKSVQAVEAIIEERLSPIIQDIELISKQNGRQDQISHALFSKVQELIQQVKELKVKVQESTRAGGENSAKLDRFMELVESRFSGLEQSLCAQPGPNPSVIPTGDVIPDESIPEGTSPARLNTSLRQILLNLTSQGDNDLKVIMWIMKREALSRDRLRTWRPRNQIVKTNKKLILKGLFSRQFIHKITDENVFYETGRNSFWYQLVTAMCPMLSARSVTGISDELAKTSKPRGGRGPTTFLQELVSTLAEAHGYYCRQCQA